jgi:hypothetical protein
MKKAILAIKQWIRFFVSVLTSREFAFCYCITGTVAQVSHTYFLVNSISSLEGGWRTVQATMLSIFISSSLLFFVAISDDEDSEAARRIHKAIVMFTFVEVVINVYYYARHIMIDPLVLGRQPNLVGYFDFGFAMMISVMIPITIKLYASHIRAKDWIIDIEHGKSALVSDDLKQDASDELPKKFWPEHNMDNERFPISLENMSPTFTPKWEPTDDEIDRVIKPLVEQFQLELVQLRESEPVVSDEMVAELVQKVLNDKMLHIDGQMTQAFERNSVKFLKQFENKVKNIMNRSFEDMNEKPAAAKPLVTPQSLENDETIEQI